VTGEVRDRAQELVLKPRPVPDEGTEQAEVGVRVRAEPCSGLVQRPANEDRRAVVERVGERRGRGDPFEVQTERPEERRRGGERVDRGADVVTKAGQRQLRSARAAADRVLRLEDENRATGLRQRERRREAVRTRADDDRV